MKQYHILENDTEAYEAGYRWAMEVDGETRYVKDLMEAVSLMKTEFDGWEGVEIRQIGNLRIFIICPTSVNQEDRLHIVAKSTDFDLDNAYMENQYVEIDSFGSLEEAITKAAQLGENNPEKVW